MSFRAQLSKAGALAASLLLLSACAAEPSITPTGAVTEVTVTVAGMQYVPDTIEVPVGNELVITFENTGDVVHDLVLDNGAGSMQVFPGQAEVIKVGVIGAEVEGWCTIGNHRAMGMELTVIAVGG